MDSRKRWWREVFRDEIPSNMSLFTCGLFNIFKVRKVRIITFEGKCKQFYFYHYVISCADCLSIKERILSNLCGVFL